MKVLLLAGEGPYFKNNTYLNGTLFDGAADDLMQEYFRPIGGLRLADLTFVDPRGVQQPLLRRKYGIGPHLTTYTLDSILAATPHDFELFPLQGVWDGDREPASEPDVVFLSTTFICDQRSLGTAVSWVAARFPAAVLVVGGQYSNLKYATIYERYPDVDYVVRGDGEEAIPALLDALACNGDPSSIPNLTARRGDGFVESPVHYIDLDAHPSPRYAGEHPIVPYESMRGCPFTCKFCSFPAASPLWRYKSARKIRDDWARYAAENGATHVRAMDSTFTVPPTRLNELLPMLRDSPVTWEAYTRANVLRDPEIVERLAAGRCTELSIGFESMSPATLTYMNKRVTAQQNRVAHRLLRDSPIGYRMSFMAGYPGETPADYALTHDFLRDEFSGHFMLSIFSLVDETMPVWQDAERFGLRVLDPEVPDYSWVHNGMSVGEARALVHQTLDDVRWGSDESVVLLWQSDWQRPMLPHLDRKQNMWAEKCVERLAMLPRDFPDPATGCARAVGVLDELRRLGVVRHGRGESVETKDTSPRRFVPSPM